MTNLDDWLRPITDCASAWRRVQQGKSETLVVLLCIYEGEEPGARIVYRRVIADLKRRGQIGNGYHDFEGPLGELRRLGLIEVVDERRPWPGELSPSCVGPGTSSVPKGSPVLWTVRLSEIGARVREYWQDHDLYTGRLRRSPTQ